MVKLSSTTLASIACLSFLALIVFGMIVLVDQATEVKKVLPTYTQVFPIERYPGLQCYIIATNMRQTVITKNCHTVYVDADKLTFGQYEIPRQTPGQRCNRCYMADYLTIVGFLLFGRPEKGVPPPAPRGLLLLEDDAVICNEALKYLDDCFKNQFNCHLGNGAMMNFFAGAKTQQLNPANYSKKRFTNIAQLYESKRIKGEPHVDWYVLYLERHVHDVHLMNHVGVVSTLDHDNGEQLKCPMNDTLAANKKIVRRYRDIRIF